MRPMIQAPWQYVFFLVDPKNSCYVCQTGSSSSDKLVLHHLQRSDTCEADWIDDFQRRIAGWWDEAAPNLHNALVLGYGFDKTDKTYPKCSKVYRSEM